MTTQQLIDLSKRFKFMVGPYEVISQEPSVISDADRIASASKFLPQFLSLWKALEDVSGHRWKCTSYIRNSPTHQKGQAIDLAPDFDSKSEKSYAVYNNSDPVLYKRATLIRQLQSLVPMDFANGHNKMGIFIEPDHLHVQVLSNQSRTEGPTCVVKWKVAKPVYPDTLDRMNLPMFR